MLKLSFEEYLKEVKNYSQKFNVPMPELSKIEIAFKENLFINQVFSI